MKFAVGLITNKKKQIKSLNKLEIEIHPTELTVYKWPTSIILIHFRCQTVSIHGLQPSTYGKPSCDSST